MSTLPSELLAYDPARGPADAATEAAYQQADAEVRAQMVAEQAFDRAFADKLQATHVVPPADLVQKMIAAAQAKEEPTPAPVIAGETENKSFWLHGGFFAMAALILGFLALAFTFVFNPAQREPTDALLAFMSEVEQLSQQLEPHHYSADFASLAQFVKDRGAPAPTFLPANFEAKVGYACQVVEVDGQPVGVICFKEGDNTYHLFTMPREAMPFQPSILQPAELKIGEHNCATWTCDKNIYVLTSGGDMKVERARL